MQPNDTQPEQPGVPSTPEPILTPDTTSSGVPDAAASTAPVVPETPETTPASEPFQPFGSAASTDAPQASAVSEAPEAVSSPHPVDQQPEQGLSGAPVPPKKSKLPLIIIIAVAAVLLLGGGVYAYTALSGSNKTSDTTNNTPAETEANDDAAVADTIARTDGTLDLSAEVDGTKDIAAQSIQAGLNDQVNLSNGISFMVTKVEPQFTGFNEKYVFLDDDEEVVALTFVVGTRNVNGNGISTSRMKLDTTSQTGLAPIFVSSLAEVENALDVGSGLDKGEQVSGVLLYAVKKGDAAKSVTYTQSYRKVGSGETVDLTATVKLQ